MRKPISYACEKLLYRAYEMACEMHHSTYGSEHLLMAIVEDISLPMSQYLLSHGVNEKHLKEDCEALSEKEEAIEDIKETYVLTEIIRNAQMICKDQVLVKHLCRSLLITSHSVALELLYKYHIQIDELLEVIDEADLDEYDCCLNLNRANRNPNVTGRDQELQWIIQSLCRKEKANVLLIGEAGVGKSALIEKLAERIETKNCPESLYHHTIYELSLNQLVAGTKYRGEFEEKLQKILHAIEKNSKSILFIDEMHQMIGAGRADGSLDVAGILKPMLARGSLKCIGATTKQEYHQWIEKDKALERRFQIIKIHEPESDVVREMIRNKLKEYEEYHHISIPIYIIEDLIELSHVYMPTRHFPDKAFDLLDMACVITYQNHLKIVGRKQIYEAIEAITWIPVHLNMQDIKKKLSQFHENQLDDMIECLQDKEMKCWYITDPKGSRKQMFEALSLVIFKQEILYLDALNLDSTFDYICHQIKLNPFSMLMILHYHEASSIIQSKIREGIRQNYWLFQMNKVSLRHVLVCILDEREIRKGYLGQSEVEFKPLDFCTHRFDFSVTCASN